MNNEIEALDLAIAKLQEQKERAIKKLMNEKKNKQEKSKKEITPEDKILIKNLTQKAEWWRTKGKKVKRNINVTIRANILWTEDKEPFVDGYEMFYNGRSFDLDDLITGNLFTEDLKIARKEIHEICALSDKVEKKYPDASIEIFT